MNTYQLFNSLVKEGASKIWQPIQRKIQNTEAYMGKEEYQNEFAQESKTVGDQLHLCQQNSVAYLQQESFALLAVPYTFESCEITQQPWDPIESDNLEEHTAIR